MTTSLRTIIATLAAAAVAVALFLAAATSSDAGTPRLTVKALESAHVPRLCGHHAGRLVNGRLPGIKRSDGEVRLRTNYVAFGTFDNGAGREAAVAVTCDRGGDVWPDSVLIYRTGPHGGARYDGVVRLGNLRAFEQDSVRRLRIVDHRLIVRWRTGEVGECNACGNVDARTVLKPQQRSKRVKVVSTSFYSYQQVARKIVRNVNAGRWHAVRTNATAGMVAAFKDWKKQDGRLAVVRGTCGSAGDGVNWSCDIGSVRGDARDTVVMQPESFRNWRAVRLVAGD